MSNFSAAHRTLTGETKEELQVKFLSVYTVDIKRQNIVSAWSIRVTIP